MKIRIIGYAGSGKTTLSKELEKKLHYKSIPLDSFLKYKDKNKRQALFEHHLSQYDDWIVEGVQAQRWCQRSIKDADIVILLDYPLLICQYRVLKRSFLGHIGEKSKKRKKFLRKRAFSLLKWNNKFYKRIPKLKQQIRKMNSNFYVIQSPKDVNRINTILNYYKKRSPDIF